MSDHGYPSGSAGQENLSDFEAASMGSAKISFILNTTSGPESVSEHPPGFSMMLNTSSGSRPDSKSFFSFSKSGHGNTDTAESDQIDQTEKSKFLVPGQDSNATNSLSLSVFSGSHFSRNLQVATKPRSRIAGSYVSISPAGLESKRQSSGHRLIPHCPIPKLSSIPEHIQKHIIPFYLNLERLQALKNLMMEAMETGLKQKNKQISYLPMLPTYVCNFPDGTERGDFLGLELTFSQVKVLLLQLTDNEAEPKVIKKRSFALPEKIIAGNGEQVFEFIAQCLTTFLDGLNLNKKYFPLGFSFPFPCEHSTVNQVNGRLEVAFRRLSTFPEWEDEEVECKLMKLTKDFRWPGMEGHNVSELLQTTLNQHCKDYQIEVFAVLNDTVAVLLSCASDAKPYETAVVIDAGTNCCYMEDKEYIAGFQESKGHMCINIELGFFGENGELNEDLTEFDLVADKQFLDQGKVRFLKMTGFTYMCEVIRIFLANLAEKGELFNGVLTPTLLIRGKLELQDIVDIIDEKVGLAKTKSFLSRLGLVASNQDCFHVQEICQAVFTRAARLFATGLGAVLTYVCERKKLPELKTCVVFEGELFRSQSQYTEIMQETLKQLVPKVTATFIPSEGCSGLGAAIAAAIEVRLKKNREGLAQVLAPLQLSVVDLERMRNIMRQEMEKGLSKATDSKSCLRMLPTFVCSLPDGTERGDFMALDLGGTNFRVLVVQVKSPEEGGVRMISESYTIPAEVTQSTAKELFDHIVDCIVDFETKQKMLGSILPMGFTFSFPCQQIQLDKGILLRWTKGFNASDCVGEDVVNLLREAVQRQKDLDVDVVALVNDTVGTMMSCAYADPNCEVGLIVGTGCNACYMEEMRNIDCLESNEGRMCINMEWGAFGDDGLLDNYISVYDQKVDKESLNPGQQRYEKLISGMYLGEIARYILVELASRKILFKSCESQVLQKKGIFPTKLLSDIENSSKYRRQVYESLEELGLTVSPLDTIVLKQVCHTVTSRAAMVCAAGVAAVVEKIRENKRMSKLQVTVGVDGTVYKMNAYFAKKLQDTVALLAPNCNVKFLLSEDGSGKGAALIAAVANRTKVS